jgi:hypothetical protein
VFGKGKLAVSPDQSAVEEDLRFLRRFGAMLATDVRHGLKPRIDRFFSSISEDMSTGRVDLRSEMPLLELIARHFPPAWLMIADLWRETQTFDTPTQIIEALSRYVQTTPPGIDQKIAWERIAIVHREHGDWLGFVNGHVQIAELPGADLSTISASVNTFNSVSSQLDDDTRFRLANRLAVAMELKFVELDATDCSRLAWLLIACDKEDRAATIVDWGLQIDGEHDHCRNLNSKIWAPRLKSAQKAGDTAGLIDAICHLAPYPDLKFAEISDAANSINRNDEHLPSQRVLASRLAKVMQFRIAEGNATDCSRLAWLYLIASETGKAVEVVEMGLALDPTNEYCLKLKTRLVTDRQS